MTEQLFHVGIKALIKNERNKYLVMLQDVSDHSIPTGPYWDLAGGRIQQGESVLQTLEREVLEETGITSVSDPTFQTAVISNHRIKLPDGTELGLVLMVYEVSIPAGSAITLSPEHTDYAWVSREEAKQRLSAKYPKEFTDLL